MNVALRRVTPARADGSAEAESREGERSDRDRVDDIDCDDHALDLGFSLGRGIRETGSADTNAG